MVLVTCVQSDTVAFVKAMDNAWLVSAAIVGWLAIMLRSVFFVICLDALIVMLMVLVSTAILPLPCRMGFANLTRVYANYLAFLVVFLGSVSFAFLLLLIPRLSTELVYFAKFPSVPHAFQITLGYVSSVPKDST